LVYKHIKDEEVEMQDDDETQRREDTVGEKKTREF
jgi:hypothetical protein